MASRPRSALLFVLPVACAEGAVTGDPGAEGLDAALAPDAVVREMPAEPLAETLRTDSSGIDVPDGHAGMDVWGETVDGRTGQDVPRETLDGAGGMDGQGAGRDVASDDGHDVNDGHPVPEASSEVSMPIVVEATWATTALAMPCVPGARHRYRCPVRGSVAPCWGTDLYTHDSSVCTAAVHAGRITVDDGGEVTFEMRAGASSYIGSSRNGVTSLSTGSWPCSFAFP